MGVHFLKLIDKYIVPNETIDMSKTDICVRLKAMQGCVSHPFWFLMSEVPLY